MRGAHQVIVRFGRDIGIIPADAGSTIWGTADQMRREDHPRGCGEHAEAVAVALGKRGSSPRMRGALTVTAGGQTRKGIIPADAGSTATASKPDFQIRDHPRGCGEHNSVQMMDRMYEGSSPRMRGARSCLIQSYKIARIIPADAGSTCSLTIPTAYVEDHPRGCGEHIW